MLCGEEVSMREYLPPHQLFEDCLNALHLEWRLLSDSELHAIRVVAAGELRDSAWVLSFDLASPESAALPGDDDEPSVQRCQRGRSKKNGYMGVRHSFMVNFLDVNNMYVLCCDMHFYYEQFLRKLI
jgi:hypothetical protein